MEDNQTTDFAGEVGKLRVLMEQVLHEVQATNEGVGAMREELATVPKRDELDELKADVKTIKAAVEDISADVAELREQTGHTRPGHAERSHWWPRQA